MKLYLITNPGLAVKDFSGPIVNTPAPSLMLAKCASPKNPITRT